MKNDFAIMHEQRKDGKLYVFVDTRKAMLRNMPWNKLGDWGKRKLENMLFLQRTHASGEQIRIRYV